MFEDFKKFIIRGNVVDMAVGIVIGAAFSAIARSLVDDVLMPPVGLLLGNVDFANLYVLLREGAAAAAPYASLIEAREAGAVVIAYGQFINTIISFLIVALAMFFVIRSIVRLQERFAREGAEKPAPAPTEKECPYCFSNISVKASRCPHCTSQLATTDASP